MRLTQAMRESIKAKVVRDVFQERREMLRDVESCVAHACWENLYPIEIRKTMLALPAGSFPEVEQISCQLPNGLSISPRLLVGVLPVTYHHYRAFHRITDKQVELAIINWHTRVKQLHRDIDTLDQTLRSGLHSAATVKQLLTSWPHLTDTFEQLFGNDYSRKPSKGTALMISAAQITDMMTTLSKGDNL